MDSCTQSNDNVQSAHSLYTQLALGLKDHVHYDTLIGLSIIPINQANFKQLMCGYLISRQVVYTYYDTLWTITRQLAHLSNLTSSKSLPTYSMFAQRCSRWSCWAKGERLLVPQLLLTRSRSIYHRLSDLKSCARDCFCDAEHDFHY